MCKYVATTLLWSGSHYCNIYVILFINSHFMKVVRLDIYLKVFIADGKP